MKYYKVNYTRDLGCGEPYSGPGMQFQGNECYLKSRAKYPLKSIRHTIESKGKPVLLAGKITAVLVSKAEYLANTQN